MQIVCKNLTFNYGKDKKQRVEALKNISLVIEEGEFFGIIGETGSGKSTFIQHLNGLIKPTTCDELKIGDFDLLDKKCDFKKLRSKVGMVFQYPEYQLFAETVFDDVAFGLKNFDNLTEEETKNAVKFAIERVGLDYEKVKDKSPFDLSGGQKRRVAIAGVIVTKPEILVLDEPASGLDPEGKEELLKLLKDLHSSFVKTIVIVSHDMNMVAEHCSKMAVFNRGEIYSNGSPKEVFERLEFLEEVGLEQPLTGYLTKELAKNKVIINTDYTVDDFIDKIVEKLKD